MSKQDDLKYLQSELFGKQDSVRFTADYNEVEKLSDRQFIFVIADANSIGSGNPSSDEIGLYAKFNGRTFKVSLSEVS